MTGQSTGMDRNTGKALSGEAHIRQSLRDIVTTPLASRVMRRAYGSIVPGVLDKPLHHEEVMETATRVEAQFTALLRALVPQVAATISA